MFKRVFKLFQIARKLSTSGAVNTINEIHTLPHSLNLFFNCISIGSNKNLINNQKKPGDKLCEALQSMGTTFIKLGQINVNWNRLFLDFGFKDEKNINELLNDELMNF